jgi:hypothetical protein
LIKEELKVEFECVGELKRDLIKKEAHKQTFLVTQDHTYKENSRLLAFLRFVVYENSQCDFDPKVSEIRKKDILQKSSTQGYMEPISKRNELAVWDILTTKFEALINRFPTTLQEDEQLLKRDEKDGKLTINEKNCISMRMKEKQICNFFLNTAKRSQKVLKMDIKIAHDKILKYEDNV